MYLQLNKINKKFYSQYIDTAILTHALLLKLLNCNLSNQVGILCTTCL